MRSPPPKRDNQGWKRSPSRQRRSGAAEKAAHHEFTDAKRGQRLQKVMAEAGIASRRHCEELIEAGEVRVNGHLVQSLPAWVDPARDHITVGGRKIKSHEPLVYIMLFKPRGVVSTNEDPEGRPRAIDLVQHPLKTRLYPVGRLDMESSGLLLLTNDGQLANRLTHPRHEVHKLYEVTVSGSLDEKDVAKLERGLFLSDRRKSRAETAGVSRTAESKLTLLKRDRDRTRLLMELGEGRNRQIRRMMATLGYKVRKLRRVALGPVKLKGLQPGQWRELTQRELRELRKSAGLETSERAKADDRGVRR